MKERPILFSAPMVRAILAGTKTQTRRIVKPDDAPVLVEPHDSPNVTIYGSDGTPIREWYTLKPEASARLWWLRPGTRVKPTPGKLKMSRQWDVQKRARGEARWTRDEIIGLCPYGLPGDRLWVREAFAYSVKDHDSFKNDEYTEEQYDIVHRATSEDTGEWTSYDENGNQTRIAPPWRPSIHMPRWASRITLEVTSVRVERLHAITEDDARAEGVEPIGRMVKDGVESKSYRQAFHSLWSQINGADSFSANPWVWVVEFKRIEAQERAA